MKITSSLGVTIAFNKTITSTVPTRSPCTQWDFPTAAGENKRV